MAHSAEIELSDDTEFLFLYSDPNHTKDKKQYFQKIRTNSNADDWQEAEYIKHKLILHTKNMLSLLINSKRYTILSLLTGVFVGTGIGCVFGNIDYKHKQKTESNKEYYIKDFLDEECMLVLFCVVATLLISSLFKYERQIGDAEDLFNNFYRRLAVRYFKSTKPSKETINLFQRMNPEMADVITKILVSNLSVTDLETLQTLSVCVYLCVQKGQNTLKYAQVIKKHMDTGLTIIKKLMQQNPELNSIMHNVFKGEIPQTFVFNTIKQNSR